MHYLRQPCRHCLHQPSFKLVTWWCTTCSSLDILIRKKCWSSQSSNEYYFVCTYLQWGDSCFLPMALVLLFVCIWKNMTEIKLSENKFSERNHYLCFSTLINLSKLDCSTIEAGQLSTAILSQRVSCNLSLCPYAKIASIKYYFPRARTYSHVSKQRFFFPLVILWTSMVVITPFQKWSMLSVLWARDLNSTSCQMLAKI